MQNNISNDPQALIEAFEKFSQHSEKLTDAYSALESRLVDCMTTSDDETAGTLLWPSKDMMAVINALPAGIVVVDNHGYVRHFNPAAEEILGVNLNEQLWREIITQVFSPQVSDGPDISLRDGRIVNISTNPLGDQPGQIVLITDVTQTRALQNKLGRQERLSAMGEMAATLAHQIRTPLASSLLYLSQLGNSRIDADSQRRIVEKIISRMRHLDNLVNDILLFAQGGYVGDDRFTVTELVNSILQVSDQQLEVNEVKLYLSNNIPKGMLKGNSEMLLSAFQNLITNSIQAMTSGGEITLQLSTENAGSIDFIIEDTGPGIPDDIKENIFDPFFTTRSQGTGLGLAVVKVIARAHGGEVWCEPGTNDGIRFIIRLPLHSSVENADMEASASNAVG